MPYFYLVLATLGVASTNIIAGFYNRKNVNEKNNASLYTFLMQSTIFACWLVMFLFDRTLEWSVLPYSIGFAFAFAVCAIATVKALQVGPVAITSLMLQLSLIGVTAWGLGIFPG